MAATSSLHALEPRMDPTQPGKMDVGGYTINPTNVFTACLWGFGHHPHPVAKEYYFWRCADMLWNNADLPEPMLEKHPWAELMLRNLVRNKYVAIGGAASSGKSHLLAAYGILFWLSAPKDTLVLMTSTALGAARQRIWGSVVQLLTVTPNLPINLRDSTGEASYVDQYGRTISKAGLTLVAAEKKRSRDAIGKFIGRKQKRILLIADELGEISEAVLMGGISNLSKNPFFQLVGMSNPASRFDAFGVWSTPRDGWDSVNIEVDDEWDTKWGGKYLRLDGERSPNILAGKTIYNYLPTQEKLDEDKQLLGETSRNYYRMVRAVFFDSDEMEGIYSDAEITTSNAMKRVEYSGQVDIIAGIDPAFTNGGDRTIMYVCKVGVDETGQFSLQFDDWVQITDDIANKSVPRTYQIVRKIIAECKKRNIPPRNVAVDSTGAGSPFCDVLAGEWDNAEFLRVNFGGKASDKRVSANSRLTGQELYTNRVSEIWFVGKEFIRTKQMRGIDPDLAREMVNRRYDMIKGVSGLRVKVEPKSELKLRMGHSPDLADAAFIAVDLARLRFGLVAMDPPKKDAMGSLPNPKLSMKALDVVSRTEHGHLVG